MRLDLDDGSSVRGTFRGADDDFITVSAGIDRRLPRVRVRRVAVAIGTNHRRHVNVGMAVGAVAAGLVMLRHCRGQADACYEESMLFYMPLMGAGAAVGHYMPRGTAWREVYVQTK